MQEQDSIYIVRGGVKSALINLETQEIRMIPTDQINHLEDADLEVDLTPYLTPSYRIPQKELLDIRLSTSVSPEQLQPYVTKNTVYQNVRIFCPETPQLSVDELLQLVHWIHQTIFHLGVILFIPDSYDETVFYQAFSSARVVPTPYNTPDQPDYKPVLQGNAYAIHTSKTNNLYHHSRDTLKVEEDGITFIDHHLFNIPKTQIEACKDCALRFNCLDARIPQKIGDQYQYASACDYYVDY